MTARILTPNGKEVVLPPMGANLGTSRYYKRRLTAAVNAMAKSVEYWLHIRYKQAAKVSPAALAHDAIDPVIALRRELQELVKRWTAHFADLAQTLPEEMSGKWERDLTQQYRGAFERAGLPKIPFKITEAQRLVMDAAVVENVSLIQSIPAQYLKDVNAIVMQGFTMGRDLSYIVEALQKTHGVAYRRAEFIARDQCNKATAALNRTRQTEFGITEAIWQHSGGGKVPRQSHVKAGRDKLRYKVTEGAYLDGRYTWPGHEPNCRCRSRSVIPGIE